MRFRAEICFYFKHILYLCIIKQYQSDEDIYELLRKFKSL